MRLHLRRLVEEMTILHSRLAFKHFASSLLRRPGRVDAHARLPEGLSLNFTRVPDGCRSRWRLVLTREGYFPTTDEVEACCIAFHIPPSVVEKHRKQSVAHTKSGRSIHSYIVELTWHEDYEDSLSHEGTPE